LTAVTVRASLALACSLLLGASCKGDAGTRRQQLLVYAASSLSDAFDALAEVYEQHYPDTSVLLNFAGSQTLRFQLERGARADIFASGNEEHIAALVQGGRISRHESFAHNELVVAVPRHNPSGLRSFADLPRARQIVVGHPRSPIGSYTETLLVKAAQRFGRDFRKRVESRIVSRESNVRLVLAKVELGQADAAIVYRSDVARSNRATPIALPPELGVQAHYYIGPLETSRSCAGTQAWLTLLRQPIGRSVLQRHHLTTAPPASKLSAALATNSSEACQPARMNCRKERASSGARSSPTHRSFGLGGP
jgi:molybdate transport system substrate-binding protein